MTDEERNAQDEFEKYFVKNYPGPTTILSPYWHAPRIFGAALAAIKAAQRQGPAKSRPGKM